MGWSGATAWWIAAGLLVAAELASGTFYLLMLALGACAGALAAHLGMPPAGQMLMAAALGGLAVTVWHLRRPRHSVPASSDPNVNLDIGSPVDVTAWQPDGSAQVSYRGAIWQARFAGHGPAQAGRHVIRAIEGSQLLLDR